MRAINSQSGQVGTGESTLPATSNPQSPGSMLSPLPRPPTNCWRLLLGDEGTQSRIADDPSQRSQPTACNGLDALVSNVACAKRNSLAKVQKTSLSMAGKQGKTTTRLPEGRHKKLEVMQRTGVNPLSKQCTARGRRGGGQQG